MFLPGVEDGPRRDISQNGQPYVEIVEQPASQVRYRYISEKKPGAARFPEPIIGINSTRDHKTSPSIKIHNYKGQAVVVVSCVTVDRPHKPHPHNLSGKEEEEGFKNGVYSLKVLNTEDQVIQFPNLGIECAKKQEVAASLKERKSIKVDPFGTGFDHAKDPSSIDLNVLRLCFQVFVKDSGHAFAKPLPAIVSTPIHSTRSNQKLQICSLSHASAPVIGDFEMNLLCGKITKDNIEIHFTESKNGLEVWKDLGKFQPLDVHQNVAIKFRTPCYKDKEIENPVNVQIRLYRPSDGGYSNAVDFILTPIIKSDLNFRRNFPKSLNDDFLSALIQQQNIMPVPPEPSNNPLYVNHPQERNSSLSSTSRHPGGFSSIAQDTREGTKARKNTTETPMQLYAPSVVTDSQVAPLTTAIIYESFQTEENLNQVPSSASTTHHHPEVRLYEKNTYMVPLTSEQASHQLLQQHQDTCNQLPHFCTLEEMRPTGDISTMATPHKMADTEMDTSLFSSSTVDDIIAHMSTEPSVLNIELSSAELASIESWCTPHNELSIM